jgi:hypothetical protein
MVHVTADATKVTPAEFDKLVALARGARGRIHAAQGAAVLDEMGRSYTGCTVSVGERSLSAVQLAVATAAASGSRGLDAVVLMGEQAVLDAADVEAIRGLAGAGVRIAIVDLDGTLTYEGRS